MKGSLWDHHSIYDNSKSKKKNKIEEQNSDAYLIRNFFFKEIISVILLVIFLIYFLKNKSN